MITKEDFYSYLIQPEQMNKESLEEFRMLVDQQPAFQSAWILYLKNLMLLNEPTFSDELKRASIYIQNRRVLYLFLHKKTEKEYMEILDGEITKSATNNLLEIDYTSGTPYQLEAQKEETKEELLSDLIDSFRQKSHKKSDTTRGQKRGKNTSDANETANFSTDEEENYVSETLACIYVKQKYYDKAIEVFEKLSLKYPEKNSYFAGQIEEIKKLK